MKQELTILPVHENGDPILLKVEKTYNDSFPEEERRDFILVKELLKENPYFKLYALLKDETYAGFITIWQWENFAYVEHFAIDEAARNGGIGGRALSQFIGQLDKPIVLEVEMPTDEMSRRRIGFYERLGFKLDENHYKQPPYRSGDDWLEMRLMSIGDINLDESFEEIKSCIHKHVYGV